MLNTKNYKSKSFVDRIEASVANISSNPNDTFKLISAYYDITEFDCELCGHKHCVHAFEIQNLETKKHLKVGSECIHHFKGKGVDIDLAEALMKRVMKATAQARKELKEKLGKEAWNKIPKEERDKIPFYLRRKVIEDLEKEEMKKLSKDKKRELITEAYMVIQAKELLLDVSRNKHVLSEEEIQTILDLGLEESLEESKKLSEKYKKRNDRFNIEREVADVIDNLIEQGCPDLDEKWAEAKIKEFEEALEPNFSINRVENIINDYNNNKEFHKINSIILNYEGNNPVVKNIKSQYNRTKNISKNQQEYAISLIKREEEADYTEFEHALNILLKENPNKFYYSISHFYNSKGYVSDKQKAAILKSYQKFIKNK